MANHFQDWTARYQDLCLILLATPLFIRHACMLAEEPIIDGDELTKDDGRIWSVASHAGWGIVQAREDLAGNIADAEFD